MSHLLYLSVAAAAIALTASGCGWCHRSCGPCSSAGNYYGPPPVSSTTYRPASEATPYVESGTPAIDVSPQ